MVLRGFWSVYSILALAPPYARDYIALAEEGCKVLRRYSASGIPFPFKPGQPVPLILAYKIVAKLNDAANPS